ncbi:dihydrolipoyl dehydrogenase [Buchnera aphidicola]|uniref:dihydrolipoyl dehydrogenase n=1 Tax=Buchnera aphidicola TaxID=9 RepID=UPI0034641ADF
MTRDIHTQVLVLGSGPAGYSAAFRSADLGLKTVLVEKYNQLGGVCLNVGCIPSKFLLHISKVIREVDEIAVHGISFKKPQIDIDIIRSSKDSIISRLSQGINYMAKKREVNTLYGVASFINNNTVLVLNNDQNTYIHFENVVIATGSKPIGLKSLPTSEQYIWNSNQALQLNQIPNRFLIVGSGIIGLEMATFYSSIGSEVDVIDRCNQIFSFLDKDISDFFVNSLKGKFNILLETDIIDTQIKDNGVLVKLKNSSGIQEIFYNAILIAIGRTPNFNELDLDKVGVKLTKQGFIKVDNQLRTNINNIYAIGDVVGQPMLAHKGIHQGHIVSEVISGCKHYFDPIVIPSVAYTDPEIAWVGMSEKEAINQNINYEISIFPWKSSGRAIVSNCTNGMTKLIINKDDNKIIGGIVIGRQAGELLGEISLAIEMGCDVEDIALTIHAHPTLYESIGLASQIFQGTITDLINLKSFKKNT